MCSDYVPALCTHRPSHLPIEWSGEDSGLWFGSFIGAWPRELVQTLSFRGRWSRNKVSVGEPAEGSLPHQDPWSSTVRTNRWVDFGQSILRLSSGAYACSLRLSFGLSIELWHSPAAQPNFIYHYHYDKKRGRARYCCGVFYATCST